MKTVNMFAGLLGVAVLFLYTPAEAHVATMASKPVTGMLGISPSLGSPIFSDTGRSLEGSKPVLLILGKPPRTTLTTSHIRREGWRLRTAPRHRTNAQQGKA